MIIPFRVASFVASLSLATLLNGQPESSAPPAAGVKAKLASGVFDIGTLPVNQTAVGTRRLAFDGPTDVVDNLHLHITTLNVGQKSGEPRLHPQEEVIIVKEGTIEANYDGRAQIAHAGSVIYFAARATTFLRNVGETPATYYVLYYHTPLTDKK